MVMCAWVAVIYAGLGAVPQSSSMPWGPPACGLRLRDERWTDTLPLLRGEDKVLLGTSMVGLIRTSLPMRPTLWRS